MTVENEVRELLDAYAAAVRAKDVDAFAALYEDDVQVFDMWGTWSYRGLDAWRGMAAGWFGSLGDEQVGVTFEELAVRGTSDAGIAHMFVRYAGLSADGEELRSLTSRMTWALERTSSGWRVVHEHTSSPADFQTGKVMLSREPE